MGDRKYSLGSHSGTDDPPNSRLFIVSSKQLSEDDFRKAFQVFGTIEEIWMVKDKQTGENKGVTYIKYAKTSEAARALEAMNGKSLGVSRNIKVIIASSRDQGSRREANEEEKMLRLFVIVPKEMTDEELYDVFKVHGSIDYATIIRDRDTRESKGFGYVKYFKFSDAATAFENCDKKFRPVFAEPKKPRERFDDRNNYRNPSLDNFIKTPSFPSSDNDRDSYTKLTVIASPYLNQDQLWKLCDIVPGMDYCQLRYEGQHRPQRAIGTVVYNSPQWAAHAKEKLHGFEYPPGHRLIVKPNMDSTPIKAPSGSSNNEKKSEILQLAETIAQASSLIKAAGLSPDILHSKLGGLAKHLETSLCNVPLPEPKPLANINDPTAARCFIVCSSNPPPNSVLKDVFCRFGGLIDVYMLTNRNCGYAKYTTKEAAEQAIQTLHGAEIQGNRIKVLEAEERPDNNRKRQRLEESPF